MTFNKMKWLDKYAGWLLCFKFTLFDKLQRIVFSRKTPQKDVKNILFIKFWGIGSIINATPLLKAIKEKYTGARVILATLTRNRDIASMFDVIDEVIVLDIDHGIIGALSSICKMIVSIRSMKIDLTFDLEFFTRFSALVTYLSGARERVGFKAWEAWRGDLHTIGVPFNRYWHVSKNFYNLGVAIGLQPKEELTLLKPKISGSDHNATESILKDYGLQKKKYVCMNPNTGELAISRRWPGEYFIQLIKKILQDYKNVKVVLIGSKKESEYVDSILKGIDSQFIVNIAGKTNIGQLSAILEESLLLISNDSGPLHLAASLNVPTISFFGPETPVLYKPLNKISMVFFKNIDCSPCINVHETKTYRCYKKVPDCLSQITPEEVYMEVKRILG